MTKAEVDLLSAKCNDPRNGTTHLVPHAWVYQPTGYIYELQAAIANAYSLLNALPGPTKSIVAPAMSALAAVKW